MIRKHLFAVTKITVITVVAVGILMPLTVLAQDDQPVYSMQSLAVEATAIEAYWTEEMMEQAQPMPVPEISGSRIEIQGLASLSPTGPIVIANSGGPKATPREQVMEVLEGASEPEPQFGTYPFSYTRYRLFPNSTNMYKTFPYRTTGKLFFTIPGQGNFVCSGASVNSTNRSVVWTAGHCVYSPGMGFHTNFIFVPARREGANPYGTWTAKQAITLNGWIDGKFEYDHGALVMNLGGTQNKKIGQAVGFLGFIANASRYQHWHLHGYPAGARNLQTTPPGAQFDGEHHEICAATFATNDLPTGGSRDSAAIGVGCDKTGGTSGGPWVIDFSGVGGQTNLLNGNNSYRYTGPNPPENRKLFSPYFGSGAVNLRNAAQAVAVP